MSEGEFSDESDIDGLSMSMSSSGIEDKEFEDDSQKKQYIISELIRKTKDYHNDLNELLKNLDEIKRANEREVKIIQNLVHQRTKKRKRDWMSKLEFSVFEADRKQPDFHDLLNYLKKLKKKPKSSRKSSEDKDDTYSSSNEDSEFEEEDNNSERIMIEPPAIAKKEENFPQFQFGVNQTEYSSFKDFIKRMEKKSPQKIDWVEEAVKANRVFERENVSGLRLYQEYKQLHNMWAVNAVWSASDEEKLKEAVKRHGTKNWKVIASLIEGKSTSSCSQHWKKLKRASNPKQKKKWDLYDDIKLAMGMELFDVKKYSETAKHFEDRTDVDIRERWCRFLKPDIKSDEKWSEEERKQLMRLTRELKFKWGKIAKAIGVRTDKQCKRKWKSLCKIKSKKRLEKEKSLILKCLETKQDIFKIKRRPPHLKLIKKTSSFRLKKKAEPNKSD